MSVKDYSTNNKIYSDYDKIKMFYYIQSVNLVYQDIYEYTKPNLYKSYSENGKEYVAGELNPVADVFFKNNLWDVAFICANAFNYFMFNVDGFSYLYSTVLAAAEIWAISTWDNPSEKKINVKATLFVYTF
jgi:hypothetical protein